MRKILGRRAAAFDPCDADRVIADRLPIETERLRLRLLVPGDLAAIHAFESRADVCRWLYWGPRSEAECREALERKIARAREAPETGVALAVVLGESGELVGHTDLSVEPPEQRQGELGFVFHPDHQGRGHATEAARAMLALGFETYRLHRIEGRAEPRNTASVRVLEKLGMRQEGHLRENEWVKGEWQSEVVYALLAREWRARHR
jgi:RimJ/RimL family protein N-acetyltransferase